MSDFGYKLYKAAEMLATGEGDVKNRLGLAVTRELIFANVPDDPSIPQYFRDAKAAIVRDLSTRSWTPTANSDRVRATIHPMRFKTAAKHAMRIWELHQEFLEYEKSGCIPTPKPEPKPLPRKKAARPK